MKKEHLDSYRPKNIKEVFEMTAAITGKTPEQLKTITAYTFQYVRDNVRNLDHPGILIHNLGSFESFLRIINKNIELWLAAYRKGRISRDITVKRITPLWEYRQLLIKNRARE